MRLLLGVAVLVVPAAKLSAEPCRATTPVDPQEDCFGCESREQRIAPHLMCRAAACYDGRRGSLHRNQAVTLQYRIETTGCDVHVHDVRIARKSIANPGSAGVRSTPGGSAESINDLALERCFVQQLADLRWHDDDMDVDWMWDDELVLRPERRAMARFYRLAAAPRLFDEAGLGFGTVVVPPVADCE